MSFGGGGGIVENRDVATAIDRDTKATHAADDHLVGPESGCFVADALKLEEAKLVPKFGWNTLGFKMSRHDSAEFFKAVALSETEPVENGRTLKGDLTAATLYLEVDAPRYPVAEPPVPVESVETASGV